jgi:quercetin dioxygenase-like cupin family protein
VKDGYVLPPGGGERVGGGVQGALLKVGLRHGAAVSAFEVTVAPGFDVGAHAHTAAEEFFLVLEGELDLLAFEPSVRTSGDWLSWRSPEGRTVARGGPGTFVYVPAGCPHAFGNPGPRPARMFFQTAPAGHELYFEEMAELFRTGGFSGPDSIAELRERHGIDQITPMGMRHGAP